MAGNIENIMVFMKVLKHGTQTPLPANQLIIQ